MPTYEPVGESGRVDSDATGFVCRLSDDGGATAYVHVTAELDIASAPELERVLRSAQLRAVLVVLDLRQLTFMDSFGLRVIVAASNRAHQAGRRLVLLPGPSQVQRLFALSGVADALEITELSEIAEIESSVQVLIRVARADRPTVRG
jgi:anti-anti-sigma factor